MPKIKILSLVLIVIGFLYLGSSFAQAAVITVDVNGVVEVGTRVTVIGTYTSSEALGLDREICIKTRRSPAGISNFEQLGTMCENIEQVNIITGGIIRKNVTLSTEGDYQFMLINRLKTDINQSETLAASSIIQSRSSTNNNVTNNTAITIDQTSLNFGERDINPQTPYSNDISVTNNSSNRVTATYTFSGDSSFSIGQRPIITHSISAGETSTETINFNPTTEGLKQTTLNIRVTNPRGRELINQNVSITGTGVTAQATTGGTSGSNVNGIEIDPPLEFGDMEIGSSSLQDFNVTNNTNNAVTMTYTLSGDSNFNMGQSNTITRSISAGEINAESISFNPTSEGLKQASLNVRVIDTNGQELVNQNVSITGTGVAAQATIGGTSSGNINGSGSGISSRFLNPLGSDTTTVIGVVRNIINGIFGLLGAIAVAMIVYGGIIYMTGGSSKDGVEKGKKIITSAVVGLVIVLLSLAIIDLLFVLLGGR